MKTKQIVFIPGEKVKLCLLTKERHLDFIISWFNDKKVNRRLTFGTFPMSYGNEEKWFEDIEKNKNAIVLAIEVNDKPIGSIGLHEIDYFSRRCKIGIAIGDADEWGKGYATEAEKLMLRHAFETMNLNRVEAGIYADNIASLKAAKKNGFVEEGVLREYVYRDGQYHNAIIGSFLKKDWK